MQPQMATVGPSLPRLLALLGKMVAGGVVAVWAAIGLRSMYGFVAAGVVVGLAAVLLVLFLVRQAPRIVISPEGFVFHKLIGSLSRRWEEVDGPFAVIKLGLSKAVAYNLTAECKARLGKKPTSRLSGYDEAVPVGALQLSAERLAELLNASRPQHLPATGDRK
jgi:hypothetical protein